MGDLIVLARIFLGWLGIYLLSRGVPPDLVSHLTEDPRMAESIAAALTWGGGALLAGGQLLWWRFAKRFGWST